MTPDDVTQPRLNLQLPPQADIRSEYERRVAERRGSPPSAKVVALPLVWAVSALGAALTVVFWMGFNWSTASRELTELRLEVRELRESGRTLDKSIAAIQQRQEVDAAVRSVQAAGSENRK